MSPKQLLIEVTSNIFLSNTGSDFLLTKDHRPIKIVTVQLYSYIHSVFHFTVLHNCTPVPLF